MKILQRVTKAMATSSWPGVTTETIDATTRPKVRQPYSGSDNRGSHEHDQLQLKGTTAPATLGAPAISGSVMVSSASALAAREALRLNCFGVDLSGRESLMSVKETLLSAGISRVKFYDLVRNGEIKAYKIGRRTVVRQSEFLAWISGLPPVGKSSANGGGAKATDAA